MYTRKAKIRGKGAYSGLKEEGISSAKIAKPLGQHRASNDSLLTKTKGLPNYQIAN
jgi:hypothetical protein